MSQACARWRGDIGAYIVGALDPGTSADVRRHLRSCDGCRSEYEELLPVRDWLTQLSTGGAAAKRRPSGPVLRAVGPARTRAGRRWLATAVTAVAAAAIGVFMNIGTNPVAAAFRATDHATGVHGQARLNATPAGTRISLNVSGLPANERCRLVAVSRRGGEVAASWNARYDGTARIVGTSGIPEHQITALRVESASHRLLLVISLGRHPGG
jgi:hypothetical protein